MLLAGICLQPATPGTPTTCELVGQCLIPALWEMLAMAHSLQGGIGVLGFYLAAHSLRSHSLLFIPLFDISTSLGFLGFEIAVVTRSPLSLSLYFSTFRFVDIWNISFGRSLLSSVYVLYFLLLHLTCSVVFTPPRANLRERSQLADYFATPRSSFHHRLISSSLPEERGP